MKEADEIIQSLRMIKEDHKAFKDHELIDAKKRLEEAVPSFEKTKKPVQKKMDKRALKPGDEVKVLTFGQKGTLLEKTDANEWNVQIGILKMKVKEKDLEFLKSAPEPEKQQSIAKVKGKDYHVSLELDLRESAMKTRFTGLKSIWMTRCLQDIHGYRSFTEKEPALLGRVFKIS